MKILFVSMPSIHAIRWIENLKDANHELYWFDVLGRGGLDTSVAINQFTQWKKRKIPPIKGEFFLYKNLPKLHSVILPFLEKTANEALAVVIENIQPDLVHSFEMQGCSYPILKTMNKYPEIPWLYSCWGNDIYYYKNYKEHYSKIKSVLKRVNFLHTDCERDAKLALEMGFSGEHLGVIPGGAGYDIKKLSMLHLPVGERKIILVKGYEHLFGRGLNVIKALEQIQSEIHEFQVVVFAAHPIVISYVKEKELPFTTIHRSALQHDEVLELMGKSLVYVGNNISDGMPNTLLEAIVMGAFPIQSNPGGATAEIIEHGKNGLLIEHPEEIIEIKKLILRALTDSSLLNEAYLLNKKIALERLDYKWNEQKIIGLYEQILNGS
jgi:glycosyltransferase involved in cell wall biosynthesis